MAGDAELKAARPYLNDRLAQAHAARRLYVLPLTGGYDLLVRYNAGWLRGPDGTRTLAPDEPLVPEWVQLLQRWKSLNSPTLDEQRFDVALRGRKRGPHDVISVVRQVLGRWTSPYRQVWVTHACGHGDHWHTRPDNQVWLDRLAWGDCNACRGAGVGTVWAIEEEVEAGTFVWEPETEVVVWEWPD